ncbi:MAG: hypothetical protein J0I40_12650, partial [Cellulomonas sp.]|nr:hypothetical protein [Cellulomonas sp.]
MTEQLIDSLPIAATKSGFAGDPHSLIRWYVHAKRAVVDAGFVDEIVWQASAGLTSLSRRQFVREAAWVVLAAGMSDFVVRRVFPRFASAMFEFRLPELTRYCDDARSAALSVFGHVGKVDAILQIAQQVAALTDEDLRRRLVGDAEGFLRGLPYVGPVTWRHLAKNVGVQISKPDRHMVRLSHSLGWDDCEGPCREIAEFIGDPVAVVDVVGFAASAFAAGVGETITTASALSSDAGVP